MRIPKKPRKNASTFDGLRSRIQGAPIGSTSDILVQRVTKAKGSLSAQELKELTRLIAGRIANGELT